VIPVATITAYAAPLAAALVAVMAIVMLRPLAPTPSIFIAAGGGMAAVRPILMMVGVPLDLVGALWLVLAVGLIAYGLVRLIDERFPPKHVTLPLEIQKYRSVDKLDFLAEGIIGFFALAFLGLALAGNYSYGPPGAQVRIIAGATAVLLALAGSVWLRRRYTKLLWILERTPESVVWVYVHKTFVINRGTTYWSGVIALASGNLLVQPTPSEAAAQELLAAVLAVCPGACAGYDAQRAEQFRQNPRSLRSGAQ
jgi:hypothetical protein